MPKKTKKDKECQYWRNQVARKETLIDLGFVAVWPCGNPIEPWWENKELNITFFERPACSELMERLARHFRDEGAKSVQVPILVALGISHE